MHLGHAADRVRDPGPCAAGRDGAHQLRVAQQARAAGRNHAPGRDAAAPAGRRRQKRRRCPAAPRRTSRAVDGRGAQQALGAQQHQHADRGHLLRAVEQRQALLGLELDRLEPAPAQRLGAVDDARLPPRRGRGRSTAVPGGRVAPDRPKRRPTPATARPGWMPRRRKSSSRSTISGRQPLLAVGQRVGAQQHHRAHDRGGQCSGPTPTAWLTSRFSEAVATSRGRDALRGEVAEAGRDAVDDLAPEATISSITAPAGQHPLLARPAPAAPRRRRGRRARRPRARRSSPVSSIDVACSFQVTPLSPRVCARSLSQQDQRPGEPIVPVAAPSGSSSPAGSGGGSRAGARRRRRRARRG